MSKISNIENLLTSLDYDAIIIPMQDYFGSEYLDDSVNYIKAITNFTGSNAFIIITANNKWENIFFTDGRYTLQAKQEVKSNDFCFQSMTYDCIYQSLNEISQKKATAKIAFNPQIIFTDQLNNFQKSCPKLQFIALSYEELTSLNQIIFTYNNSQTDKEIFLLDEKYSGQSSAQKLSELQDLLCEEYLIISNSEEVCWLFNIRGNYLTHTPVVHSKAILTKDCAKLFIDLNSLSDSSLKELEKVANIFAIEEFSTHLQQLKLGNKISYDAKATPVSDSNILKQLTTEIINKISPLNKAKAIKNSIEIENIRKAHIADGITLAKFFYWLEQNIESSDIDEYFLGTKLAETRRQSANTTKIAKYYSESFPAICGLNENGAIIHYKAKANNSKKIALNSVLLLDNGGQYFEGTTDVTRTTFLGNTTNYPYIDELQDNFTRVLQGHIAIAKLKFPKYVSGKMIDVLARQNLWQELRDYPHGTGHGVGYFLNVHEGPQGISRLNDTPIEAGMIISNEPGYYAEGKYGIRTESIILAQECKENTDFLCFETLTQYPIDINLIKKELLTKQEVAWLNTYHQEVYKKLSPYLDENTQKWLFAKCRGL